MRFCLEHPTDPLGICLSCTFCVIVLNSYTCTDTVWRQPIIDPQYDETYSYIIMKCIDLAKRDIGFED